MRRPIRAPAGALLALTLALGGCGSGSGDSASMGKLTDSKAELGALFDRLKGAGAVRIVQRQVDVEYQPDERGVLDVHFAPFTWRERTYLVKNDKLVHDQIRRGDDLLDLSYSKSNCPVVNYTGWFLWPDFAAGVPHDENLQVAFAPGILPHVLHELQYTVFDGRTEEAGGYVLTGKVLSHETGLGWGYDLGEVSYFPDIPIRLRLDGAGRPAELTVDYAGSLHPSNSFTATFSYDDVEPVPTISNPRVFDEESLDLCENYV